MREDDVKIASEVQEDTKDTRDTNGDTDIQKLAAERQRKIWIMSWRFNKC